MGCDDWVCHRLAMGGAEAAWQIAPDHQTNTLGYGLVDKMILRRRMLNVLVKMEQAAENNLSRSVVYIYIYI